MLNRNLQSTNLWFVMMVVLVTSVNCGSAATTSTTDDSPALSSIDDLPLASAPVVSSDSAFSALNPNAAVSGVTLKTMDNTSFDGDSSLGMCNMAMNLKDTLNQAAQGDRILCYVQNTLAQVDDVDIYDGEEHVFDLTGAGEEEGGAFRVKMKIVKTGNVISSFQMWACDGVDLDHLSQTEYLSQTIDGTSFTLDSVGTYSGGEGESSHSMNVVATLNSSGEFLSKTMTSSYSSTWGDNDGYGTKVVEQGADSATVSMWQQGNWSDGVHENTYGDRVYGVIELLNSTLLSTIAVGDGGAIGVSSGTFTNFDDTTGTYDFDYTEGWDGDTTASDPESLFVADLEESLIPDFGDEPTIAFTGDAAFDCTGETTSVTIDQAELDVVCSDLELGYEWVNCYDTIQNAE